MRNINKNKKRLILKHEKIIKHYPMTGRLIVTRDIYKDTKYDRFKTVLLIYKMYINIMHIKNKIDFAQWAVIAY